MDNTQIANTVLFFISFLLLFGIVSLAVNAFISGKEQKKYQKEMKVGDKIYVPMERGAVEGYITDINGDDVEISTTFKKWRIYKR